MDKLMSQNSARVPRKKQSHRAIQLSKRKQRNSEEPQATEKKIFKFTHNQC